VFIGTDLANVHQPTMKRDVSTISY